MSASTTCAGCFPPIGSKGPQAHTCAPARAKNDPWKTPAVPTAHPSIPLQASPKMAWGKTSPKAPAAAASPKAPAAASPKAAPAAASPKAAVAVVSPKAAVAASPKAAPASPKVSPKVLDKAPSLSSSDDEDDFEMGIAKKNHNPLELHYLNQRYGPMNAKIYKAFNDAALKRVPPKAIEYQLGFCEMALGGGPERTKIVREDGFAAFIGAIRYGMYSQFPENAREMTLLCDAEQDWLMNRPCSDEIEDMLEEFKHTGDVTKLYVQTPFWESDYYGQSMIDAYTEQLNGQISMLTSLISSLKITHGGVLLLRCILEDINFYRKQVRSQVLFHLMGATVSAQKAINAYAEFLSKIERLIIS